MNSALILIHVSLHQVLIRITGIAHFRGKCIREDKKFRAQNDTNCLKDRKTLAQDADSRLFF